MFNVQLCGAAFGINDNNFVRCYILNWIYWVMSQKVPFLIKSSASWAIRPLWLQLLWFPCKTTAVTARLYVFIFMPVHFLKQNRWKYLLTANRLKNVCRHLCAFIRTQTLHTTLCAPTAFRSIACQNSLFANGKYTFVLDVLIKLKQQPWYWHRNVAPNRECFYKRTNIPFLAR